MEDDREDLMLGDEATANPADTKEMNFLEHLEELRWTLVKCFIALVVGCGLVMVSMKLFAGLLNWPLQIALGEDVEVVRFDGSGSEIGALPDRDLNLEEGSGKERRRFGLITTTPMGVFSVILQVCFLGGLALSLPFILYFVGQFVAPGLTERELVVLKPGCAMAFFLFLIGSAFSFAVLIPASLRASIFFNELFGFQVLWSADRYYGLLVWMTVGIGFSFEFPLILVFLVYLGIIDIEQLKRFRPYSVVAFLGIAAIITPTTDPLTFMLLAVPMSLLYEISILISRRVERAKSSGED